MADNWSASPITLTDPGDWAKWTITLGSGDADNLNNAANDVVNFTALRFAMSAPSRQGFIALMVNDTVSAKLPLSTIASSSSGWISANRFQFGITGTVTEGYAVDFPEPSGAFTDVEPWVAGANTVRLLWYGGQAVASADPLSAEPIEIDFLSIQAGAEAFYVVPTWTTGVDDDSTDDPKPTAPPLADGYDDHSNPDPINAGSAATWILEGDDAATGTAADSLLTVVKFCPPDAKIRVTGAGSPLTGIAGCYQAGETTQVTTLDGNGEATFTVIGGQDAEFWFGGSDAWAPALVHVEGSDRIGCGGWQLGLAAGVP